MNTSTYPLPSSLDPLSCSCALFTTLNFQFDEPMEYSLDHRINIVMFSYMDFNSLNLEDCSKKTPDQRLLENPSDSFAQLTRTEIESVT